MAFVGETPWHKLGQRVTKGASLGIWAKEAGMDWSAVQGTPSMVHPGIGAGATVFEDYKGLIRSDTQEPLAIVGANYQIVQPADVLEFFRDMTESGGWHIHTAGTLRGGRKLWAMASNGEGQIVGSKKGGDEVMQNLLLATSMDGSMKTTAMLTAVRVVCANTLAIALNDANAKSVRISHRQVFDADAVRRTLGVSVDSFKLFMAKANEMAETPIKLDEARDVLARILDPQREAKKAEISSLAWMGSLANLSKEMEADDSRVVTGVLDLFQGAGMGSEMRTAKGTRWGLLNAVTQYVDHAMGRTDDTRLDSAFFGRGANFKQQAMKLLSAAEV
jgi:phage/plasmid-like protein (TIGR03299 family)